VKPYLACGHESEGYAYDCLECGSENGMNRKRKGRSFRNLGKSDNADQSKAVYLNLTLNIRCARHVDMEGFRSFLHVPAWKIVMNEDIFLIDEPKKRKKGDL